MFMLSLIVLLVFLIPLNMTNLLMTKYKSSLELSGRHCFIERITGNREIARTWVLRGEVDTPIDLNLGVSNRKIGFSQKVHSSDVNVLKQLAERQYFVAGWWKDPWGSWQTLERFTELREEGF